MELHAEEEYPEGARKEAVDTPQEESHKTCGDATKRVAMDLPRKDPCPTCGCPAYWATIYEPDLLRCPDCEPWPSLALVASKHAIVTYGGVCYLDDPYYRHEERQEPQRAARRTTPGRSSTKQSPASGSRPDPQPSLFDAGHAYYL